MGDLNGRVNGRVLQQPRTKPRKSCAFSQILLPVGGRGGEDTGYNSVCSFSPALSVPASTSGWCDHLHLRLV